MSDEGPATRAVFSKKEVPASGSDRSNPDEARLITPIKFINRGQDTLDKENRVIFSDFRPTPDGGLRETELPKDSSAPEPVSSEETASTTQNEPQTLVENAQEAISTTQESSEGAAKEGGKSSPNESSKPSSSTKTKSG